MTIPSKYIEPHKDINIFNFFEKTNFDRFFLKNGLGLKSKISLSILYKNINYFFLKNSDFIKINYFNSFWIVEHIIDKKFNFHWMFKSVINLLKSPFIAKSISIPKRLRKRTKEKYTLKIIYANESKRVRNSYKQLSYHSGDFSDEIFNTRLFKSILYSFLEQKESNLFKLKLTIFKKFFKF